MKIIEAMKRVKANKEKIVDLQGKIKAHCANLSIETPVYGDRTRAQIDEWVQSCLDTARDNVELLTAIARTNLATQATITLGGEAITKSLAEWIWRRREYAGIDRATWETLTDRGLRETILQPTVQGGTPTEVKIVRYYDPKTRDEMVARYRTEAAEIDSALEVVNAVTDIVEA